MPEKQVDWEEVFSRKRKEFTAQEMGQATEYAT